MDEAIGIAAEKSLFFDQTMKFKEEVSLVDRVASFSGPATIGLKETFPILKDAPGGIFMLMICGGIVASGTHTQKEVESAFEIELPEFNV